MLIEPQKKEQSFHFLMISLIHFTLNVPCWQCTKTGFNSFGERLEIRRSSSILITWRSLCRRPTRTQPSNLISLEMEKLIWNDPKKVPIAWRSSVLTCRSSRRIRSGAGGQMLVSLRSRNPRNKLFWIFDSNVRRIGARYHDCRRKPTTFSLRRTSRRSRSSVRMSRED